MRVRDKERAACLMQSRTNSASASSERRKNDRTRYHINRRITHHTTPNLYELS